jgi:oligopeptide transport system permease protein
MWRFVASRIGVLLPTLFVIVTLSFFLMRVAPGGPFDADAQLEPEILENLRAAYDLDRPVLEQFGLYLAQLARGDLGPSISFKDYTVSELIAIGLPVSLQLGLTALLLATLAGVPLGILAAANQNRWLDHAIGTLAMTGIAVPSLITAPLLTLVFGVTLKVLPVAGWGDGAWENRVLPLTALVLPQLAIIARLSRGSFLDVRRQNFIRAARARGLPEWRVAVAGVMTGSIVIEQIFGLPGVGRYFVQGALSRDYPLVMGVVIVYASAVLVMNLLADLAYAALDPRIRRGFSAGSAA